MWGEAPGWGVPRDAAAGHALPARRALACRPRSPGRAALVRLPPAQVLFSPLSSLSYLEGRYQAQAHTWGQVWPTSLSPPLLFTRLFVYISRTHGPLLYTLGCNPTIACHLFCQSVPVLANAGCCVPRPTPHLSVLSPAGALGSSPVSRPRCPCLPGGVPHVTTWSIPFPLAGDTGCPGLSVSLY